MTSITYPSGRVVEQAFDAIGRLCRVGGANGSSCTATAPFASGFGYNTAFQVTGFNYGNGVVAAFGYSADRLQLTSLAYTKNTTTLLSLAYGYAQGGGNNGQTTSITDNTGTQEAGRSVTYSYDALYRLSTAVTTGSASYPQWGLSWTYDRYGYVLDDPGNLLDPSGLCVWVQTRDPEGGPGGVDAFSPTQNPAGHLFDDFLASKGIGNHPSPCDLLKILQSQNRVPI